MIKSYWGIREALFLIYFRHCPKGGGGHYFQHLFGLLYYGIWLISSKREWARSTDPTVLRWNCAGDSPETPTPGWCHTCWGVVSPQPERILSGFLARLETSASWEVRIMAASIEKRDAASVTGANILWFRQELGADPRLVTPLQTRMLCWEAVTPIHPEEEWKLDLISKML